jgi:hypothetical protein
MVANYVKAVCPCALDMSNEPVSQTSRPIKNIVLVHGGWSDGSGWKGVYDILVLSTSIPYVTYVHIWNVLH